MVKRTPSRLQTDMASRARDDAWIDTAGEGMVEERCQVPEMRACLFVILDGNLSRLKMTPMEMRYGVVTFTGCPGQELA